MESVNLGGEALDVDREHCGRMGGSGAEEKTFSSNEKVDWDGLPDAALELPDPVPVLSFFGRPPQLSRML
jgi:hypothetical protein